MQVILKMEIKASETTQPTAQPVGAQRQTPIAYIFYFKNVFEILIGQLQESGSYFSFRFPS